MRKLLSLILALSLVLGLACARAEQDNFLVSDWSLLYTFGDSAIAEQTVFIYEDNTFEVMDGDESKKGTWTFDGETLVLTADDESVSLELHIGVDQGVNISAVSRSIMKEVSYKLTKATGIPVKSVDVFVDTIIG